MLPLVPILVAGRGRLSICLTTEQVCVQINADCGYMYLTHHPWCGIYVSMNWVSIGLGNGLLPARHQAITWTNADLLSIGHLGTNFSEIRIKMHDFLYPPKRSLGVVYWIHPVRPSVCLSVCPSVRPWVGVRMITLILFSGFTISFLHISLGSGSCMGLNISVLPH